MKLIAIDSSGLVASVAVLEDDTILAKYSVNYKKTHSQTLLPMLDELKKMTELDLETVDAIAVAKGPGSFTGLRIGSATAKGLAFALEKPVIEIPTMEGMAYQLYGCAQQICPMMDARRSQVYTGIYQFVQQADGSMTFSVVKDQCAVSIEEIIQCVNEMGKPTVFLGDGVPVHKSYIAEHVTAGYSFAPPHASRQDAGALASLAKRYYEEGRVVPGEMHRPEYLRLSQAERERLEAKTEK